MKGDHGKHDRTNPMTYQLKNILQQTHNSYIIYITVINVTQMMMGKQWVKSCV